MTITNKAAPVDMLSASERVKADWERLTKEQRDYKLRGLRNLTLGQRQEQSRKSASARKGLPSPFKGTHRTVADKKKISQAVKSAIASYTPEKLASINHNRQLKMSGKTYFELHPEVASELGKQFWADPEKARLIFYQKPTKPERLIEALLNSYFPNQWRYVGNGKVWLGHKCPDFINVDGKKKIIEVFGTHWHNIFDTATRIEHFRQYGFDTLIIWDDELKNQERVLAKIKAFNRRKNNQYV